MIGDLVGAPLCLYIAAPFSHTEHSGLVTVVDGLVTVSAFVVRRHPRLGLIRAIRPLDLPKLKRLHLPAVRAREKITVLNICRLPPLPDVARLERRR